MLAWITFAFVFLSFTPLALIAGFAFTDILIESIFTGPPIHARIGGTFIDIRLASWSIVTSGAATFEACYNVFTFCPIHAGLAQTFIDLCLTVDPSISGAATTLIAIDTINAFSVETGI